MKTPLFRQNETVGIIGTGITGKIVKVTKLSTGYQYRVAIKAIDGSTVYFTEKEYDLYSL